MNDRANLLRTSLLGVCLLAAVSFAQSAGVSDERVNLPNAPGSISGVGENASVSGNQGGMAYSVKVEVPPGFTGVTPEIALRYSSNGGTSVLGMGWSMDDFSIERMTSKGLQHYDTEDRFVVGGSDELVRVAQAGASATYRSRFESDFVRYTWLNPGTGAGGSWKAEYPDGRVGYYGADAMGAPVAAAQVSVPGSTPTQVFRWHLVTMIDRFGHAMNVSWTKDPGGVSLIDRVDYLYDNGQPRHSLRFVYEARPDFISDAKPGFELQLKSRLKEVRIFSGAEVVRAYLLSYEAEAVSGGASRLMRVNRVGRGNVAYPVAFSFAYSQTLGGACNADCAKPFVKSMGSIPNADFANGRATLIDMNGDALPDVVYSTPTGAHSFYYGKLDSEGQTSFTPTATPSALAGTGANMSADFVLGTPAVQVIDVNGDGFVDITQPKTNNILCNNGSGDWVSRTSCAPAAAGAGFTGYDPQDDSDAAQQDPKYVRFFDYDNDKRIDWLRTIPGASSSTTLVIQNTPMGYVSQPVETIGAVFDDTNLQLADMNGDGLQDPVQLVVSGTVVQLQYKLNYGFGNWADTWSTITLSGLDATQASSAELQDINGDGLADVVAVTANEVLLALNRNGDRFAPVQVIDSSTLGSGSIPTRQTGTLVAYADMNGNGSEDIVWFQPNGAVSYLELFPVRPNLISRIDNGIGAVQRFSYGTSIFEQARDTLAGQPWNNKVPNPMTLVTSMQSFVTLTGADMGGAAEPTGLREVTRFRYHSGYYDGVEKQFRGYEGVERQMDSDMSRDAQEPGLQEDTYDVGKADPDFAGRLIKTVLSALSASGRTVLTETRSTFEKCPVAPATGTFFVCDRATTTIITERDPANAVTTREERDYDGYGQVIRERNLGVVNRGTPEMPMACAPCTASGVFGDACGDQCLGDESYTETDFIAPGTAASGNLWLAGRRSEDRSGAVAGTWSTQTRYYYDAPDFEGKALGQLSLGNASRVERKLGTDFVTVSRSRYDTHGNEVETIDALGTVGDATKHRMVKTYEAAGRQLVSAEKRLGNASVDALRQTYLADTTWEVVGEMSEWFPVKGGTPLAPPVVTRFRYDEHGRVSLKVRTGETNATASVSLTYELADPASRLVVTNRAPAAGAAPLATVYCFDGKARQYQTRRQINATSWDVEGFYEFDARDRVVRSYRAYLGTSGACDVMPPTGVPFERFTFDAAGRGAATTMPGGALTRTDYGPLRKLVFSEGDTASGSPHANTPTVETFDGLGRVTSRSRQLTAGGALSTTRLAYDAQGNLATVRDAAGNLRTQTYDAFGRVVRVEDTNSGATTVTYDLQGNVTSTTDARGTVVMREYDGANRGVAMYDAAAPTTSRTTSTYDYVAGCTECTNGGGRLVQATWADATGGGEDRVGYDARGNLVFGSRTIAGHAFVTRWTYDFVDRLVGVTHPDGTTFSTTFDGAGRPVALTGVVTAVTYDERNLLGSLEFSNGSKSTYAYDERGRETTRRVTAADGAELLKLSFTYDTAGDLSAIDDGALAGRSRRGGTFTHDAWGRLTRAELSATGGAETLDYGFDAIDNVLSIVSSLGVTSPAHVGAMTYDAVRPNAVANAGGEARGYDAAGGLATRGDATFTRDHRGRLAQANAAAGTASFTYDEKGRLTKSGVDGVTWYVGEDFEIRDGIAVAYARLADTRVVRTETAALAAQLLSDLAPASGTGPLTVVGDGAIDVGDAWLAQGVATGVVQLAANAPAPSDVDALLRSAARRLLLEEKTWLHLDHQGSVVVATDASGALRGERSFYPTGLQREARGFVDAKGFTGQEFDAATGLIHFGARELDPRTGRWDRPDPGFGVLDAQKLSADGQATTGYAYVGNDFDGSTDPSGLFGEKIAAKAKSVANWFKSDNRIWNRSKVQARAQAKQAAATAHKRMVDKANAKADLDRFDQMTNSETKYPSSADRMDAIDTAFPDLFMAASEKNQVPENAMFMRELRALDQTNAGAVNSFKAKFIAPGSDFQVNISHADAKAIMKGDPGKLEVARRVVGSLYGNGKSAQNSGTHVEATMRNELQRRFDSF